MLGIKFATVSHRVFTILLLATAAVSLFYFAKESHKKRTEIIMSEPDGSVLQVAEYIKKNLLADPKSFSAIHWSQLERRKDLLGDSVYTVSVIYRGKNAAGQIKMASKRFELDKRGSVMFDIDVPPFQGLNGD